MSDTSTTSLLQSARMSVVLPLLSWSEGGAPRECSFAESGGSLVAGSAREAQVMITDRTVSRIHAALELRPDGLWVRDLGSRNGTFVDGVRVECAQVRDGARLRLGGAVLTVRYRETVEEQWASSEFFGLVGVSTSMRRLFQRLARIAPSDLPILVVGETGVGKERVVDAIHRASARAGGPLVVVDCGSMPEHLLEAELFGHRRGAFTGASHDRTGAIEAAEGGTLFLDEIGELPMAMQPKLLRVLETRTIKRLGENEYRPVDVRVVCATHRDLSAHVNAGSFREDLYFRVAVAVAKVPPLRERLDDIPLLLAALAPSLASGPEADALLARMRGRTWLGNVRELKHYLERARVLGADEAADSQTFAAPVAVGSMPLPDVPLDRPLKVVRDEWLAHLELAYVRGMMQAHHGNVSAVARAAGLDRSYVHRLLKKHRLG